MSDEYLRGLQWVMTYYKKGMPDWEWYYPEFYAPFLCDLAKTASKSEQIREQMVFTLHEPILPYMQLLCVIAPRSYQLLPEPLDKLISSESSPLKEYMPDEIVVDTAGKRQEWEGIVVLPHIDISLVKKYYDKYIVEVGERDKYRNCQKSTIKICYVEKINYNYKSFYGDIENCNAKTDKIEL